MQKKILIAVAIVVAVGLLAAGGIYAQNRNKQDLACKNCNVLIVGYDTVGAKHVSSLGYSRQTTPNLDKIASQGFSFANNYSPASWTVPTFVSVFTSRYPTQHKVVNKYTVYDPANPEQQVISNLANTSPNTQTLAQQFKANGYITGAFTGDSGAGAKFGNGIGFDTYYETEPFGSMGGSSNEAISWLKSNPNKKFFMFLHGYDAHGQHKEPAEYPQQGEFVPKDYKGPLNGSNAEEAVLREKQLSQPLNLTQADAEYLNGIYDSKIKDGDAKFGEFWQQFQKMGLDKNTIVIMMGDHGEEWNEHGGIDHGHTLYNELVHVPLVVWMPNAKPMPTHKEQVGSLDIAPTLIDLAGIKASSAYMSQVQGKSLRPILEGKDTFSQDAYLETDYLDAIHLRGIQTTDGWKYIINETNGKEELYDTSNDPGEKKNLIKEAAYKQTAEELRLKVRNHLISMGDNPDKQWTTGCLPVYPTECRQ